MAARRAGSLALALALVAGGAGAQAAGPTPAAPPTVSGTLAAGDRLQAGTGTWTSASTVSYRYQWYRCNPAGARCASVHGATAAGYTLTARDAGKTIGLAVTASDGSGSTVAYASLVGPVAAAHPLLVSTAQPQVAGLAVEGQTLQVTAGGWSPAPAELAYAWQRCNANGRICAPIPGARGSSYVVTAADAGHALAALVRASFGATTQAALSTATGPALAGDVTGPTHTASPAVSGTARQGEQLSGSTGAWRGIGSLSYAFQWYRCDEAGAHCSSVHGATGPTYRTVAADVGHTLGFAVRATDSTGTAAAYASLVGPVAPAQAPVVSTAPPFLAGSPRPGATLTVDAGVWQPPPDAVSYAWRRCNANGRICVPIAGADGAAYAVTGADVGHALVAVVTATAGTATQRAWSTASAAVR
ncbi:MAG TPA: hypothetical protein VFB42_06115 [Gaiellaceae bacterium]|nr:hypothetical protein [Gaiellaceae bacterium]